MWIAATCTAPCNSLPEHLNLRTDTFFENKVPFRIKHLLRAINDVHRAHMISLRYESINKIKQV